MRRLLPFLLLAPLAVFAQTKAGTQPIIGTTGSAQVTATGSTTARTLANRFADVVNVKDFGCVGDGTTNNATCFAAVAAIVNATTPSVNGSVSVLFPRGTYNYSSGLVFTSPVQLIGQSATLNYTGSSYAVKLGPDGLTSGTYSSHIHYGVTGLTFIGGASMLQGVYFNTYITEPRVTDCTFVNFGATTAQWAVYFQSQNWDARVMNSRMYASDANVHNFVRANGIDSDGTTSDQGQTRLTVLGVLASNQASAAGTVVGLYWNGANASISDSKIEGFSPPLWIGSNAGASSAFAQVDRVYMEVVRGANPCVEYGETAGTYTGAFTEHATITDSYCNVHNTDFATTAHFLGPAAATSGLQGARVRGNLVTNLTASQPIVVLNNAASQTGNLGAQNLQTAASFPASAPSPLHTAGGSITAWDGTDETLLTNGLTTSQGITVTGVVTGTTMASFSNGANATGVVQLKAGASTAQTMAINFLDWNGAVTGDFECSGSGGANRCTVKGPGSTNSVQFFSSGQFSLMKGLDADGGGGKHKRVAGCATAASLAATCTTTVTWGTAFADANYTAVCNGDVVTSGVPTAGGLTAKAAASVTVQTVAATAAAAQYTTIDCVAVHD